MEKLAIISPTELKDIDLRLEDFETFVRREGDADPAFAKEAKCLVCYLAGGLVGTAALKTNQGYREKCFKKAGVQNLADHFPLELGYIAVVEGFKSRGISHLLVAGALSQREGMGVYATSNILNARMHSGLEKRGFFTVGVPWESETKRGEYVALFLSPGEQKARPHI
jgi:hypothetical protein